MPSAIIDAPFSLRPTKILENADKLMEHTRALYETYEQIMKPIDRTVAEDKMTLANDFRHGVEGKSWLAQAEQAKLYFNQAQEALATVKETAITYAEADAKVTLVGRSQETLDDTAAAMRAAVSEAQVLAVPADAKRYQGRGSWYKPRSSGSVGSMSSSPTQVLCPTSTKVRGLA
ncbi:hypothetical protein EDB84DRAFT_1582292 [Lactarius hengduanensis]|nr:hypothetical protein EDB84DRAFT_1582292 [Lactarius hengduanensis]